MLVGKRVGWCSAFQIVRAATTDLALAGVASESCTGDDQLNWQGKWERLIVSVERNLEV